MKWPIHVVVVVATWLFVYLLITVLHNNKCNYSSTISRHKDDVPAKDDTKLNARMLKMNLRYLNGLVDLRSDSSEELQGAEYVKCII